MSKKIESLIEEQNDLIGWLSIYSKTETNPEQYEKEEKEILEKLEENRCELFKLTGHPRYHDDEQVREEYFGRENWMSLKLRRFLWKLSEKEVEMKYYEHINKVDNREKFDKLLNSCKDTYSKIEVLVILLTDINMTTFYKSM